MARPSPWEPILLCRALVEPKGLHKVKLSGCPSPIEPAAKGFVKSE